MVVSFEMYVEKVVGADAVKPAVEFVRISFDNNESFRPATDDDRDRYRAAYRAFKETSAAKPAPVVDAEPVKEKKSGLFGKKHG